MLILRLRISFAKPLLFECFV